MKSCVARLTPLACLMCAYASSVYAENSVNGVLSSNELELEKIVVTTHAMSSPLVVMTDPKIPRQPLPAHDGADYLKTIPGFNVMRKGGTDGEAVFRGMAGSRLNIMVDEQNVVGGCSYRMDAPTAYIFPEVYDKMTVIKGPQTVQYANMGSAGTVKFDRETVPFGQFEQRIHSSALVGSFGRHDEIIDAELGNEKFYAQITGTNSQANDYKDGNGTLYHSRYHRWSGNTALGWTPDRNTKIEISAGVSNGWAAYADRGMDGVKFLRENFALKVEKKNISPLIEITEYG
jgi:iron complex outermembrane recepter protein